MIWTLVLASTLVFAEEVQTISPYIDGLRKRLETPAPAESSETYLEKEKRKIQERDAGKLGSSEAPPESYIDRLKAELPEKPSEGSYIDDVKRKLQPKESGGAIQAVHDGRSQLELKRPGQIRHAVGLRVGAAINYNITADAEFSGQDFKNVYDKFAPDLGFTYEYRPFHSEWFGSLALVGNAGVTYHSGIGRFQVALPPFPLESKTKFSFWQIPISFGASYHLNLLRLIRPYVFVGPAVIGYIESRSEKDKSSLTGYSTGLQISGGVAFLLDWLSNEYAWDMYQAWSVKHYYLVVEYLKMTPLTGPVHFNNSGLTVGMTFEY